LNIPPGKEVQALIHVEDPVRERLLLHEAEWVKRLAKILPDWTLGPDVSRPKTAAAAVGDGFQIFIPIGGLIDPEEEIRRLEKQLSDVSKDIGNLEKKLATPSFLERAPAAVVEKDRDRLGDAQNREAKLRDSLSRIMEIKG
jgi:valyl-tRNA synthetase